ncbi:hypothetical protein pb186bvf_015474 [Paramecium bursaria]
MFTGGFGNIIIAQITYEKLHEQKKQQSRAQVLQEKSKILAKDIRIKFQKPQFDALEYNMNFLNKSYTGIAQIYDSLIDKELKDIISQAQVDIEGLVIQNPNINSSIRNQVMVAQFKSQNFVRPISQQPQKKQDLVESHEIPQDYQPPDEQQFNDHQPVLVSSYSEEIRSENQKTNIGDEIIVGLYNKGNNPTEEQIKQIQGMVAIGMGKDDILEALF